MKRYPINLKVMNKLIEPLEELKSLVGMDDVKKSIIKQILYFLQNLEDSEEMLHTVIKGPPGVGKTMLGYILGKIYYRMGIIKKPTKPINKTNTNTNTNDLLNNLFNPINITTNANKIINPITGKEDEFIFKIAKRSDLIGQYVGHTAIKTTKLFEETLGGVLFIDEAYQLGNNEKSDTFSKECIDTINQLLTTYKGQIICIIAGYNEDLEKCFFNQNQGLRRRFTFSYEIKSYTNDQLSNILINKIINNKWILNDDIDINYISNIINNNKDHFKFFGGSIETWFLNIKIAHSCRIFGKNIKLRKIITKDDLLDGLKYIKDNTTKINEDYIRSMYI
jgi:SpoVK/Ycf46/Vps4 family AAA+-type ATPase